MPITLITGPANAGKARALLDAVRRHLAHGEDPLLVVPTRADVEHYLHELSADGSAIGVRVERFAGLIGELVRRAGTGEEVLGAVARERVLMAVSARAHAPTSAGFVRALGELFAELRVRRAGPARFAHALSSDALEAHLSDLGRMYEDYCRTLERLGRVDEEQRAVGALDALRERPALWGATPVLFYGFDDLTPLQLDVLETLGRLVAAPVTVSLAYEPGRIAFAGRAAGFQALAPLAREHVQLNARAEHYAPGSRPALGHLERFLFEPDSERVDPGTTVALLEGGGERAELELVAAQIGGMLGEGVAAESIAVLVRSGGTDLDMLEEVLSAAQIPFALRRRRAFASTATGRALLGLLRCVPTQHGAPAGELEDLLAWLRAPGTLGGGSGSADAAAPGAHASPPDRLELWARRAGVAGAQGGRALWEQRYWPLERIDRLAEAQARGPAALCEHAARELQRIFSAPRRGAACVLAPDEHGEAGAVAVGRRALAELRELARARPELAPASAEELAQALARLELVGGARERAGGAQHAHGPADAVAVLDPLELRARRVRALFVCGLQEGVFPARARRQPLLDDAQRRRLAQASGLRLGAPADQSQSQLEAERYLLYAAVSRPHERLFLSWHVADDEGEATPRSLFVDDVCDLFAPELFRARARRPLGAIAQTATAATARQSGVSGSPAAAGPQRAHAPASRGAPDGVRAVRDERVLARLRERAFSPSSLERWIGCPMGWFVERVLRPDSFEPDPEPLARGGLAHAALKDTLERVRAETGSARITAASLSCARAALARALAEGEPDHPLSATPERRVAVRRRLQVDLERYLEHAAAAASPLEPSALELGFGFEQGDPSAARAGGPDEPRDAAGARSELAALELGDGVRLRGRIDRVDVGASGEAIVYDYKGARAPAGARWLVEGSLQVALYMRVVEQLLGLRVVGGFYQPLTGEDLRARGVLDADGGVALECVAPDVLEHGEVRELLERAVGLARQAAGAARRGELRARPQTCAFRGGCMYPSICRCER
ncbi:MAG TPA: PD-(D/E)XK nuclease family protein [Solirubrobacteraceae bacterium]|nr:PD-(D/E)XK nuclease family protein [Solirubrobacteraceae bacterium]